MFKRTYAALVGLFLSMFMAAAHAAPPDYTALTTQIDFSTTTVAVLAIAGLIATVYMTIKGAKIIIGLLKGA